MSAWSDCVLTIRFSRLDHKCSIKKLLQASPHELISSVEKITDVMYKVHISCESEKAWAIFNEVLDEIKRYDSNVSIEGTLNIRYFGR